LPGHRTPTTPLTVKGGPCPEPVRVQHGLYDQMGLIPEAVTSELLELVSVLTLLAELRGEVRNFAGRLAAVDGRGNRRSRGPAAGGSTAGACGQAPAGLGAGTPRGGP
jgi:hypothetical protein